MQIYVYTYFHTLVYEEILTYLYLFFTVPINDEGNYGNSMNSVYLNYHENNTGIHIYYIYICIDIYVYLYINIKYMYICICHIHIHTYLCIIMYENTDSFMDEKIIKKRKMKNNLHEKKSVPLTEKKVFADGRLYFGKHVCLCIYLFMYTDMYL
jgi:hypothetical protein